MNKQVRTAISAGLTVLSATAAAPVQAQGAESAATYFQQRDFHAALVNGTPPKITARDGHRSVVMGAAAQQSIATGQPVNINFED